MFRSIVFVSLALACAFGKSDVDLEGIRGYITVNESADANLYYWFFKADIDPANAPLVLWMTGGPGCSSELALFFENGPYQINTTLDVIPNRFAWNQYANLLYVDQPVGTGFSYADEDYVTGETLVGADMYTFLQKFFAMYPQFMGQDFYIVGESYGGHYVPTVAAAVVAGNANKSNIHIELKGVGIGNGLVDPIIQDASYGPFAMMNGLIDESEYEAINSSYTQCQQDIDSENWIQADEDCEALMGDVLEAAGNINVYNIKLPCIGPLCYDLSNITNFLNTPSVQDELGVDRVWNTCSSQVGEQFYDDIERSFAYHIPVLLAANVRVVVYNGMLDLICNWVGGYMWTSALDWPGKEGFNGQDMKDWILPELSPNPVGHYRTYNNFTFIAVENAGHMVPHDQPQVALQILDWVIAPSL